MKHLHALLFFFIFHVPIMHIAMEQSTEPCQEDVLALWRASKDGKTDQVKKLLAKGITPNIALQLNNSDIPNDTTFLHWASWNGHVETACVLLDAGADVNARDANGWTPIYPALAYNREPVVDFLLERGASLTNVCNLEWTPLRTPIWYMYPDLVQKLLARGATTDIIDKFGSSPLHWICETFMLPGKIIATDVPFHLQEKSAVHIMYMLRKAGANRTAQSRHGNTPLHIAAEKNNPLLVASLLIPLQSDRLKALARNRLFTFLCALKRNDIKLPKGIEFQIFSHLPLDCFFGQLMDKIAPLYTGKATFLVNVMRAAWPKLQEIVCSNGVEDFDAFATLLAQLNYADKRAHQMSTNPDIQHTLNPEAWKAFLQEK